MDLVNKDTKILAKRLGYKQILKIFGWRFANIPTIDIPRLRYLLLENAFLVQFVEIICKS